jgi:hypothetical protein
MGKTNWKITTEQRNLGISEIETLLKFVDNGNWAYSKSKLRSDFQGYKFHTWTELHPALTGILVIAGFFLGLFPAIGLIVGINIAKAGRERYELHLNQSKNGRLAA